MSRTFRRPKVQRRKGRCSEKNCKYCVVRVREFKSKRAEQRGL